MLKNCIPTPHNHTRFCILSSLPHCICVVFRMVSKNKWKAYGIALLLLSACDRANVYQKVWQFENHQWPMTTVLDFSFQIKITNRAYDIFLLAKHSPSYPYQNLYVTYYLEDDTEHLLQEELVNCPIFHPKTGKPLGHGIGNTKTCVFPVVTNHQFSQAGLYRLKLEHSMRTDVLPGLQAIGVKVVPSKPVSQ